MAPRDGKTLTDIINYSYSLTSPCALRYPRGSFVDLPFPNDEFVLGKAQVLKTGKSKKLFLGYGAGVRRAYETELLHDEDITLVDLRFVKPLDVQTLKDLAKTHDDWYVFSDSQKQGGVGSAILEFLNEEKVCVKLTSFEYGDKYIQHGDTCLVEESLGLLPSQLVKKIK